MDWAISLLDAFEPTLTVGHFHIKQNRDRVDLQHDPRKDTRSSPDCDRRIMLIAIRSNRGVGLWISEPYPLPANETRLRESNL
jgi:hypothetical protein